MIDEIFNKSPTTFYTKVEYIDAKTGEVIKVNKEDDFKIIETIKDTIKNGKAINKIIRKIGYLQGVQIRINY